ncbi:molybdopterin-containing oxidoreductase family protein [Tepidimicrobium xylanilyticum]|uniref:molybdopterin-containing oxidoreductase family protein n=1 Tax=Tepidimicrobium xylanilyticum TaxID=1123352 RepID=UPI00265324CF|nr:molybdopterin-dependent oxidoreductase [Tepidimicrobium xylanilyticum]GMG95786.1 putative oxidoreductase YyaE [Tepidimicrobium xylanilyticum]
MAKYISTSCTLDCWDSCSIIAKVKNNKIISISGDERNHATRNFLCKKGMMHIKMLEHPDRIRKPMIKEGNSWKEISWDKALDIISYKLDELRSKYPTTALLHWYHAGNIGLLKNIDSRFFNAYGGVTVPVGSLCAGAGNEAQRYDFGKALSHDISDVTNSNTIIIWGRNPINTGIHLVPFLKEARKKGAYIILIDPIETETKKLADFYISPNPGTDGTLALTIANLLIEEGLVDNSFINKHTLGFDEFKKYVADFTLERGSEITGIKREDILFVARKYGTNKPSSIILGFGVQRYTNGGYTIRAIDALGAITGNIGIKGGGVNYNNNRMDEYIDFDYLQGQYLRKYSRKVPRPEIADFILTEKNPEIKMLFISRANPITQCMDTQKMIKAFEKVDFKVTIDMFKTDTANLSDIILPCRHFLEDVDLVCPPASHSYLNLCNQVVEPEPWIPSELWIYNELAKRLGLKDFPIRDHFWWLERVLMPLTKKTGISIEDLKNGPILVPGGEKIPWEDRVFKTPSGKYEFYSSIAKEEGFEPLPVYKPISIKPDNKYPFYLLTPHSKDSLHSQHFVMVDDEIPTAYINKEIGLNLNLSDGDLAEVYTEVGSLQCKIGLKENLREDVVIIYEGWWVQKRGGVNNLIPEKYSEIGKHAAYYECLCNIRPIKVSH